MITVSGIACAGGPRVWAGAVCGAASRVAWRVGRGRPAPAARPGSAGLVPTSHSAGIFAFSVVLSVSVSRLHADFSAIADIRTHAPTHSASCLSCLHLAVGHLAVPETLALSPHCRPHCALSTREVESADRARRLGLLMTHRARIPPSARCRDCLTHSLDDDADPLMPPQDHMGNP